MVLPEREPVPGRVGRDLALPGVLAEVADQVDLEAPRIAAEPQQRRLESLFGVRTSAEGKVRPVAREVLLPGVGEESLLEVAPALDVNLLHGGSSSRSARATLTRMAKAPALPSGFELPLEPRLPRIGSVDQVAVEERAATLARRSIKRDAKLFALDLAVRMMDLTTLEGQDTPGKIAALCSKAARPDPVDRTVPPVAAVCVYPNLVPIAKERLEGTGVKVASVATGFPSGQYPTEIKVADVGAAVELGADEIDMVIDRGAFLSGRYAKVYDEIVRVKDACGGTHLKVILETGELGTYDNVRRASLLAMAAGADFIKTSTGKISPAATLPVALVMLEAIRDVQDETGRKVGFKPAGGIRHAKQAVQHLVLVHETLGPDWLTPDLHRFGASSLLNDVLMQIRKERTGTYQSPDYFTID